jgi:prepilin-type N-terminal cleavage/methylation domain-containing protein
MNTNWQRLNDLAWMCRKCINLQSRTPDFHHKGGIVMPALIYQKAGSRRGFTLMELIVALSILSILSSIAIPAYSSWLPEYKLKNAVRDLYSNMYLARMLSIKRNDKYKIIFYPVGTGSYRIVRPDGTTEKTIKFSDYDPTGGIGYGKGNATEDAKGVGNPVPADGISYQNNKTTFNSKGVGSWGYVYLANRKGTVYAIGSRVTGILILKKWNKAAGRWE